VFFFGECACNGYTTAGVTRICVWDWKDEGRVGAERFALETANWSDINWA